MYITSKLNNTHDGSPNPRMRKSCCGSMSYFDEFDGVHVIKLIQTYIYAYIITYMFRYIYT